MLGKIEKRRGKEVEKEGGDILYLHPFSSLLFIRFCINISDPEMAEFGKVRNWKVVALEFSFKMGSRIS